MGKQMIKRSLNTDLPNEILIKNARILSTAVYRYWHNQFLERAYAERPPVRDTAYACGSEFSSDSSTAEKNRTSKISSGTASVDSAPVESKRSSDSGSLLSWYSVRFAELGNRISKVLNFVCRFYKFSSLEKTSATVLLRPSPFAFLGDLRWTH